MSFSFLRSSVPELVRDSTTLKILCWLSNFFPNPNYFDKFPGKTRVLRIVYTLNLMIDALILTDFLYFYIK